MTKFKILRSMLFLAAGAVGLLGASAPALAQHGGGGHAGGGGFHGGGGHVGAGYHGGGYHGGYGGYGYRGGYGYYHGGYGWRGGYGWGGWGWGGVGLGLYFATLPYYYSTVWWGGVPYYYADDVYYRYDPVVAQYETVTPPDEVRAQAAQAQGGAGPSTTDLIAYPKNGQSSEQQSTDKYECHRWAATQTGFDPTQGAGAPNKRSDYMRAQAACLEGRGYSVK